MATESVVDKALFWNAIQTSEHIRKTHTKNWQCYLSATETDT